MIVKLLTKRHLEFLSLKGGCIDSSESTLVKMSNCWKSHALPHLVADNLQFYLADGNSPSHTASVACSLKNKTNLIKNT